MLTFLAKLFGNLTKSLIQFTKKGRGEAAPGLVALFIDHNFIKNLHKKFSTKILITGTNGKTTTTNLVSQILTDQNISHLHNLNGSNLERGIASALLNLKNQTTTLWECDEAAFVNLTSQIHPTHIIINNLFRDQLDRYGEINNILDKWIRSLSQIPSCQIIINCDDPNLYYLSQQLPQHQFTFFSQISEKNKKLEYSADALFCPHCHKVLKYKSLSYSHLGSYSCSCGFTRPSSHFSIKSDSNSQELIISQENNNYSLMTNLIGRYNYYNIISAFSLSQILNLSTKTTIHTIKKFQAVIGRQELIKFKNKNMHLLLVKNPTGFNQVLETFENKKNITILIALNDQIADGTDVSWIWDVNFEKLSSIASTIIATGNRVYDLALRIKYSNFNLTNLIIEPDKEKAIQILIRQSSTNLYILPTYTALWQLRKYLI